MKAKTLLLIFLLAVVLASCGKSEFTIDVQLSKPVNESYGILYYASDKRKGWITETALTLQGGKCSEHCATRNPTVVWVSRSGQRVAQVAFYAGRGDNIEITGDDGDPLTWRIGGNSINEEWSRWRIENIATLRGGNAEKVNAAVAAYVGKHRDSELSTLLMLTTYDRHADEQGYAKLWNSIDSDAKDGDLIAAVGRADQLTAAPVDEALKIKQMDIHCKGETIMNIRAADYDALAIYFSRGDEPDRRGHLDSLRRLFSGRPEGKRLGITDISLARDSMSWLNNLRADSLAKAESWLHGWAPGGRMHSSVVMFDIPRSPWFVVLDGSGRQAYRGDAAGKAMSAARELLRKAPVRAAAKKVPEGGKPAGESATDKQTDE